MSSSQPLTAQTTEGPYYFDPKLVRADITEGLSGVPLDIAFTVFDLTGRPFANARVDVWHCDAQGLYSGYSRQGENGATDLTGKTFLRRAQLRDTLNSTDGIAIEAGETVEGTVREAHGRYIAALTLRVDPNANPAIDRPPVPGAGGRPPGPPPPGGPGMRGGPPRSAPLEGDARIKALVPRS